MPVVNSTIPGSIGHHQFSYLTPKFAPTFFPSCSKCSIPPSSLPFVLSPITTPNSFADVKSNASNQPVAAAWGCNGNVSMSDHNTNGDTCPRGHWWQFALAFAILSLIISVGTIFEPTFVPSPCLEVAQCVTCIMTSNSKIADITYGKQVSIFHIPRSTI